MALGDEWLTATVLPSPTPCVAPPPPMRCGGTGPLPTHSSAAEVAPRLPVRSLHPDSPGPRDALERLPTMGGGGQGAAGHTEMALDTKLARL